MDLLSFSVKGIQCALNVCDHEEPFDSVECSHCLYIPLTSVLTSAKMLDLSFYCGLNFCPMGREFSVVSTASNTLDPFSLY